MIIRSITLLTLFLFYSFAVGSSSFSDEILLQLEAHNTSCSGTTDGRIITTVSGGFLPYTYSWSHGSTKANPTDLPPGTYTVTVTDAVGATKSASIEIEESEDCKIFPNLIFTPNGDGIDDSWAIIGLNEVYKNFLLVVYNRWGQKVFSQEGDVYQEWNGNINGNPVPDGSYYFVFCPNKDKPSKNVTKGCVTIIR